MRPALQVAQHDGGPVLLGQAAQFVVQQGLPVPGLLGLDLGVRHYSRADLEAARDRAEALRINVLGLASIASDVTPELARAAIASVTVLGALRASPGVRAALADRMS